MVATDARVVSSIASFIGYLNQIIFTIIMVGFLGNGVTRAIISMRRLNEVLDTEPAMTFPDIADEDLARVTPFPKKPTMIMVKII